MAGACVRLTRDWLIDWFDQNETYKTAKLKNLFGVAVGGDVMSGAAIDYVGANVPDEFGDSRLNSARIFRLFVRWTRFTHFCVVINWIVMPTGGVISADIRQDCVGSCPR